MVTRDELRVYCLAKPEAAEDFPFDEYAAVYKVAGKMFALVGINEPRITLKCDPDHAEVLREMYAAVQPGYYMNKRHWNTITLDGTVPDNELLAMIDESYRLVVKGLPKADRERLRTTQP